VHGSDLDRPTVASGAQTIAVHRFPESSDQELLSSYADWVMGAIGREVYLGWLFERDGSIVAGAGLVLLEWGPTRNNRTSHRGRIVNVYTHPNHRREGIATLLVKRCLKEARARGVAQVGLGASGIARHMYEKLGFEAADSEMLLTQHLG
jgi:GNAT superfamily N-acetyltransferase